LKIFNDLEIRLVRHRLIDRDGTTLDSNRIILEWDNLPPYDFIIGTIEIMEGFEDSGIEHELEHYDIVKALTSIDEPNAYRNASYRLQEKMTSKQGIIDHTLLRSYRLNFNPTNPTQLTELHEFGENRLVRCIHGSAYTGIVLRTSG